MQGVKRANEIQIYRKKKGLTQYELSKLMGLSAATISYYERGIKQPSLNNALKLSVVLDTSIEKLFPLESSYQKGGVNNVPTTSR